MDEGGESRRQRSLGAGAYGRLGLHFYDAGVLGLSSLLLWRCPSSRVLAQYQANVSANHLDVGVGTGYFLDKVGVPGTGSAPRPAGPQRQQPDAHGQAADPVRPGDLPGRRSAADRDPDRTVRFDRSQLPASLPARTDGIEGGGIRQPPAVAPTGRHPLRRNGAEARHLRCRPRPDCGSPRTTPWASSATPATAWTACGRHSRPASPTWRSPLRDAWLSSEPRPWPDWAGRAGSPLRSDARRRIRRDCAAESRDSPRRC